MAARTRFLISALVLITSIGLGVSHASPASATTTWYPVVGRVVDGLGNAQYPSNLVACPYVGTTYDCAQRIVQPTGPFGFAVLKLNTTVRYHVFAAVKNPNPPWPCPVLTGGPDIVYLSNESFDGLPDELPQRARFTVVKPNPSDCAPVTVLDDAGDPVPGAGLFVNGDARNGITDSQGIINVKVTPGATYEIGAYLVNSGWPCPAYTSPDGSTFHFSERRTVTAEELSEGTTTFVIRRPSAYDCVEVTVTDDAGNPVPGAGLFVDDGFGPGLTDAQGVVRLDVEPDVVYQLGAFLPNSGWSCPYIAQDGSSFHFSESRSVSAEELLDGETFVIRKPDPSECAPPPPTSTGAIRMFDEAGAPLAQAFISYCEYDPARPPSYPNDAGTDCPRGSGFRAPDADGVIRVPVSNPDSQLDITGYLPCTDGWYLFGDYNTRTDNGYTFWTITANDLITNGLDLEIIGDVAACLAPAGPS